MSILHCPACMKAVVEPTRNRGQCDHCGYIGEFEFWTEDQAEIRRLRFGLETTPTIIVSLLAANARGSGERQRALQDASDEVRKHVESYLGRTVPA